MIYALQNEWRQAAPLLARSWDHFHRLGSYGAFDQYTGLVALLLAAVGDDEASATLHGKAGVTRQQSIATLPAMAERLADSEQAVRRRLGHGMFDERATRGRAMDHEALAAYMAEKLEQVTKREHRSASATAD